MFERYAPTIHQIPKKYGNLTYAVWYTRPAGGLMQKSFVRKQKSPRARIISQIETTYAVASSTRLRLILMPVTGVGFAQQQQQQY